MKTARPHPWIAQRWLVLMAALALGPGCTFWSVAETDGTFEDSLRTYTKLVRWGELERASLFVEPDMRAEFLALKDNMERLHFTDFDIGPPHFRQENDHAHVTVTYTVYDERTLIERKLTEIQRWNRAGRRTWNVEPDLGIFEIPGEG